VQAVARGEGQLPCVEDPPGQPCGLVGRPRDKAVCGRSQQQCHRGEGEQERGDEDGMPEAVPGCRSNEGQCRERTELDRREELGAP
jgi:hypothetical protein